MGIDLLHTVDVNCKKVILLKLFRKMSADSVQDWWDARIASYGTGYSSKILEEEEIDFDDEFIDSCEEGLEWYGFWAREIDISNYLRVNSCQEILM